MARAFAYRFRVRHDELDSFGHLNNAVCVKYMQAAIQASTDAGYSLPWYEQRGVAWVVRRLEIRYYLQVRYGEELAVTTWISECGRSTCIREYDIRARLTERGRAGQALCLYRLESGQPLRLPEEIKIALAPRVKKRISEFAVTNRARWKTVTVIVNGARCRVTSSILGRVHHTVSIGSSRHTITLSAWPAIRWGAARRRLDGFPGWPRDRIF
jgi:YbgC/YbaW family acyl-CoA thioester hydrolase